MVQIEDIKTYPEVRRSRGGVNQGLYNLIADMHTVVEELSQPVPVEPKVETLRIPADAAAADVWEKSIFRSDEALTVTEVRVIPDADMGQATNFMTFSVVNKGINGEGTDSHGLINVNSTNPVDAYVGRILPLAGGVAMDALCVLALKKAKTGDGESWPGGLVKITYEPATE